MTGADVVQGRVMDAVLSGSVAGVPVSGLIPDLPPSGGPIQFDRSTIGDQVPVPEGIALVDLDDSEGPVLKFMPADEEGLARVQLLMTFGDTEPLPLGEMLVRFDAATGELTGGTGLSY